MKIITAVIFITFTATAHATELPKKMEIEIVERGFKPFLSVKNKISTVLRDAIFPNSVFKDLPADVRSIIAAKILPQSLRLLSFYQCGVDIRALSQTNRKARMVINNPEFTLSWLFLSKIAFLHKLNVVCKALRNCPEKQMVYALSVSLLKWTEQDKDPVIAEAIQEEALLSLSTPHALDLLISRKIKTTNGRQDIQPKLLEFFGRGLQYIGIEPGLRRNYSFESLNKFCAPLAVEMLRRKCNPDQAFVLDPGGDGQVLSSFYYLLRNNNQPPLVKLFLDAGASPADSSYQQPAPHLPTTYVPSSGSMQQNRWFNLAAIVTAKRGINSNSVANVKLCLQAHGDFLGLECGFGYHNYHYQTLSNY